MPFLPVRVTRVSRRLLQAPLFTSVAILTLALGIGANTAIFSVIRGVLLKPLPFDHADELVGVWHTATGIGMATINQSPALYLTYREDGRSFEDSGMWDTSAVSVTGAGEPERVTALVVTDGTLGVLRVQPAMGRRFTAEDDSPKAPPRVMLAHAYWERKFGSDPAVIGKQVTIDGRPHEIVGVLPAGFAFLDINPQLVLPFALNRAEVFVGNFSYQGIARLKPGVTMAQANADVARMIPLVMERFPMPPGFTRQMFEEVRLGPNVRPLVAGRDRRRRQGALAPARHGRHRFADCLRQRRESLPGAGGRPAAGAGHSRGARRRVASDRVGAALGEPDARA